MISSPLGASSLSSAPLTISAFSEVEVTSLCSCTRAGPAREEDDPAEMYPDADERPWSFALAVLPEPTRFRYSCEIATIREVLVLFMPMSIRDRTWFRSRGLRPSNHRAFLRSRLVLVACHSVYVHVSVHNNTDLGLYIREDLRCAVVISCWTCLITDCCLESSCC